MTPASQFHRHAGSYDRYNIVQTRVARYLASRVAGEFGRIADIGCGSGGFFRAWGRPFSAYLAIDIAPGMLARHPDGPGVEKIRGDFDDGALYGRIEAWRPDLVVSSSALQWSKDLDAALGRIADLGRPVALALFCDGTFASLRQAAQTPSPIRGREETISLLAKHFDAHIGELRYRLYFQDKLALFRYIKRSGVSGGRRMLDYGAARRLVREYPHSFLEFEIVYAVSRAVFTGL